MEPARELYHMGKYATALLVIVLQLSAVGWIRADEQIRQLQEELRKRHLFFGNPSGEFSPALATALSRYQDKKGFPVTGLLDVETCVSLGIPPLAPRAAPTPFVVAKTGEVNGELPPCSTPLFAMATDSTSLGDARPIDNNAIAPAPPNKPEEEIRSAGNSARQRTRMPGQRAKSRRETNPLVLAYQTVDHALKRVFGETQPRKKRDPKKHG
jgi:peptidoglycan hydrolase-like protein with peptidoglycan-binding domain